MFLEHRIVDNDWAHQAPKIFWRKVAGCEKINQESIVSNDPQSQWGVSIGTKNPWV
jgi:hypothetical protein